MGTTPRAILIQGNARRLALADASVHCAVTSPPYWGLRDYGVSPDVWGGDPGCRHEWGDERVVNLRGSAGDKSTIDCDQTRQGSRVQSLRTGQWCRRCDAWLGCLGLEPTPELFVEHLVEVMRDVRRVLRPDGTLWLNLGDSYANDAPGKSDPGPRLEGRENVKVPAKSWRSGGLGLKKKDLVGIPWMAAFALRADGWYLRQEVIWHKPNPMPSSVTDRCTTAHESVFLLAKSASYFYDADAIREPVTSTGGASFGKQDHDAAGTGAQSRKLADPRERNHPLGRNKRSVWTVATQSFPEAHFATFPVKLITPCVQAGTSERGCCRACGAPWRRVVERTPMVVRPSPTIDARRDATAGHGKRTVVSGTMVSPPSSVSIGWQPTCACTAGDPVPCTVLDPFNGAATTGVAALQLGRRYVGVERKAEYLAISGRRLERTAAELSAPKRARRERKASAPVVEPKPAPAELPNLFSAPAAAGKGAA